MYGNPQSSSSEINILNLVQEHMCVVYSEQHIILKGTNGQADFIIYPSNNLLQQYHSPLISIIKKNATPSAYSKKLGEWGEYSVTIEEDN